MSRMEYLSIRGEQDFLYRYFLKCGGQHIAPQIFKTALARWLKSYNIPTQQGINQIVHYLDKKFA